MIHGECGFGEVMGFRASTTGDFTGTDAGALVPVSDSVAVVTIIGAGT